MTQYKLAPILVLTLAMALPATAATGHDAITTTRIAAAISDAGMTISAGQVTLLTNVVAKMIAPRLKVQSIEPWGDHRMKVRMGCSNSEACLPFYVAISDGRGSALPSASIAPTPARPPTEIERVRTETSSFVVRAGSLAILLLDGNHVHIQLTVVCLENGTIGQTIRVASKDHRQTYSAEVFEGGVLRGRLWR